MLYRSILFLVSSLASFSLFAQIELSEDFRRQLDAVSADILRPLDTDFKAVKVSGQTYVPAQFALYSRRERLEIRYYVRTEEEMGHFAGMPHVDAGRMVMNLGSNEEDAVTSVHSFDVDEAKDYGADWARMFTFSPKAGFSATKTAQMIALYREKVGMIYIFLLFNEAPDTLDNRQLAARFLQ